MRSHLSRYIFFTCGLSLLSLCIYGQKKTFTDYYFEAKALADSLKTYQVYIQTHDTLYPFQAVGIIKDEVGKSFNFLKIKERVTENPDFVIKILVSDVNADVDYAYAGKNLDNNVYEITAHYDVSFALSFEAKGKETVYIPIVTKKHYETRHNYSLQSSDFNNSSNWTPIKTADQKMPAHQYAAQYEVFLNTRSSFIINFNEELARFRKKNK